MFRVILALTIALILTTAGILVFWRLDRLALAPGILTGGSHQICAPRDGIVGAVKVRSGEKVLSGQELIDLDPRDLEVESRSRLAAIEAMKGEVSARRAEIEHLGKEVHPRERDEALAAVERAKLKFQQAESTATAFSRLGEASLASRLQVEQSEIERKLAVVAFEDAEREVQLVRARQKGQIEALSSEIQRLEKEIESEEVRRSASLEAIKDSSVRSPVEGIVTTSRVEEMPGRAVRAGDELLRVASGHPDRFEGALDDAARAVVRPDQYVKIRLDGYPWLIYGTLKGRVVRVSDRREQGGGFPAVIAIDTATAPGPLRDGMRGTARIVVDEKISLGRLFLEKVTGRLAP